MFSFQLDYMIVTNLVLLRMMSATIRFVLKLIRKFLSQENTMNLLDVEQNR